MNTSLPAFSRASALTLALAIGLATAGTALAQTPQNVRVRGTITKVDGPVLQIHARDGEDLAVRLGDKATVATVVAASLSDIKPGTFIGTAAQPRPDGTLKAIEIVIFPESMRGVGEGHSPWDLLPDSTMTNATVTESVDAVDGRSLTLTYKAGRKTLVVPPDAPVVTFGPGDRSDLKPGETVFMNTQRQADGSLQANRASVSKNGVKPPM